uniref:Sulfotransferase n=1 Tax=Astyanax mexicanus TaxID=7994 RepID=A0A8B9LS71_ASTMX
YSRRTGQGVPLQVPLAIHFARVDEFQAHKDDLLIATYPKAGTTWTQEIVDLILNKGNEEKCRRAPTHVRMPFLEMTTLDPAESGMAKLEKMAPPRVIKTHLPIQLVPHSFWEAGCKIIYVARNPKDNVVSYFHFDRMNLSQPEPGPWPEYLQMFMKGELGWGSWYDHDPAREVLRIAEFLGKPLSKSVVDGIVHLTTFESMRDNPMANYSTVPDTVFDRKVSEFLRKGMVGDWQNLFSPEEDAVFEEHYYRMMADAPIPFRFYLN